MDVQSPYVFRGCPDKREAPWHAPRHVTREPMVQANPTSGGRTPGHQRSRKHFSAG